MRGAVGWAFFFLMSMSVMVFIPDLIVYGTLSYKANTVVAKTTKEAEMQGGITASVENRYKELLKEYGLDDKGFKVSYNKKGEIQYNDPVKVEIEGEYTFKSFNLLGTGVGQFKLPIRSSDSGHSEVWYR
ncbi:DUF4320 family protein [Bacillus paralicheniformis]|jgi:hypothetical protein|uniref:DUF4320 family protein n=1 Tax=Bacillus TaxID=1386 RepID=UPI0013EE87A7|nr:MULTISPECIES: DUF4320 family protein [Bacillus]QII26946.1 DUF4320 family protein [Bacillus altitudinis]QII51414.1 DUF4320 family protein [Bacillus paralicheniformis]